MSVEDDSGAGGFAAGEPWYLDVATGEWSWTPPPPDRRRPPGRGVITKVNSTTVTLDAGPVVVPSREPGNRRARRAAKARARGHRRGALDDRGALGTIEAAEHGVLHVRMPGGALERIEVHDPEGWFVVGGIVTIGGAKAGVRTCP